MTETKESFSDVHTLPLFSLPDEILALMIKFKIKSESKGHLVNEYGFIKLPLFQIFFL